jgi:hypothetical protein
MALWSTIQIVRIAYFLETEFFTPRNLVAGAPQGSVLAPVLYSLHITEAPAALELILSCSRTIPAVFTRHRNMNAVLSVSSNAYSLQCCLKCVLEHKVQRRELR